MPEDKQDDHSSNQPQSRPHLQVRIRSEPDNQSTSHHIAGGADGEPNSSSTSESLPKEKTADANVPMENDSSAPQKSDKKPEAPSIKLPTSLQWIPANWTWSKWKPVLRSALAAWVAVVIFAIPTTENLLGQASFLIIIASFLSPPSDPLIAVLEREIMILLFVGLGWAWSCLGLKLADLARSVNIPNAPITNIISGQYIEAGPTVIMAVFIFLGSIFFLYIKARLGPGPFLFACVFGCICIDISLSTSALFPYPYYKVGQLIMLPLTFHSAIALILSVLLFPSSISALFTMRLQAVLSPLATAIKKHREHLQCDITSPEFSAASIIATVDKAEGALPMLAAAARLLKLDIIYSRFAPTDYGEIHALARRLTVRANGMNVYYTLIDPTRERFPITPAPSTPATPTMRSPTHSRPPSPERERSPGHEEKEDGHSPSDGGLRKRLGGHHHRTASRPHHLSGTHSHHRHHSHPHQPYKHSNTHHSHHNLLHSSLLHLAMSRTPKAEPAVGVFESHRYLNLEATHLSHPDSERYTARATELLSGSCQELLKTCGSALQGSCDWLGCVRDHRLNFWVSKEEKEKWRMQKIEKYEGLHSELSAALDEFTDKKRLSVLDPYRVMFTPSDDPTADYDVPPHRYLFQCYVYQFHLIRFAILLQSLLGEIIRLEKEREKPRLWLPSFGLSKLAFWAVWEPSEVLERDDDENPEMIPGIDPALMADLGQAVRRDPDALPPRNTLESVMNWLHRAVKGIGGGNALFAIKAGALTIILTLPSFIKSSAAFAYKNKFVWAVFMGQLTLARFRGDTTFGLVARICSTFIGGIIGTVMWYISTGSGQGNPFGLAAVCFVCFPFFFFVRLYWPVPPMTNLIIFVTSALVFGYSYEDTHLVVPSSPGWGIDVAWRRFVLVTVGVIAAGIFSFLPPSTTIRSYQRTTLATTSAELGSIYCSVVSFANTRREEDTTLIVQKLLAIRSKLKRSIVLKTNAIYEFSLRGRWPAKRYQRILELQLQISFLLSHLMSVVEQLEPAWAHAFLRRTRMLDADFQGDVLAVISLISSSLRTGNPLPQVTPCPLLDRFMVRHHGLNVIHEESADDFGLPKTLTLETLESLQYLTFCVGVSTAFSIVTRLDQLMVAVKELVGEQYHIDGVGLPLHYRRPPGVEMRSPTISLVM
ncbi:hypothetical protein HYDPIDRAFT_112430 [Hydnomerulius pinastri MD-312]|uniref:ER transporter 6TM N-terminal domain-containing protein n=1 Tax=Hydnomerulius pinastri MD-312 TaxID=994086 RepID=A0A0C9W8P9_9AGAM|nr:hypothetical protein HYDPIDRAFT_112430 [Hydnomerulius pinastri MD-312]